MNLLNNSYNNFSSSFSIKANLLYFENWIVVPTKLLYVLPNNGHQGIEKKKKKKKKKKKNYI